MRAVIALALLAALSLADEPASTCDGVPPPPPLTDVVIEPNAPRYAAPACLEGETCTLPEDWDTREFLPDGSVRHEFTYVGELKAVEGPDGTWTTQELVMLPAPPPACWAWQWRKWQP